MAGKIWALETIAEVLIGAGWKRRRVNSVFTRELGQGLLGWVGLSFSPFGEGGQWFCLPKIGVVAVEVEARHHQLLGEKFSGYYPPTVVVEYQQLTGRAKNWEFPLEPTMDATLSAEELGRDLIRYGQPWLEQHSTQEQLLAAMRDGLGFDWVLPFTTTLLLEQMGERQQALDRCQGLEEGKYWVDADQATSWVSAFRQQLRETGGSDPDVARQGRR